MWNTFHIISVERKITEDHHLQDDSQREWIEFEVIHFAAEHLRRHLVGRSLETGGRGPYFFAEAQVYNFDFVNLVEIDLITLEAHEDVLQLQVPVQHVDVVDVADAQEYEVEYLLGFGFRHATLLL